MWVVPLAAIAAIAPPAHAKDRDATQIGGGRGAVIELGAPKRIPTALDSVPHPWPGIALSLSALGAAVPVAIASTPHAHGDNRAYAAAVLLAEVVTPSAGHLYAGLTRRALIGMAPRAVGTGIALAAGLASNTSSSDFTYSDLAIVFGATMVGVSALWDVGTVAGDVEQRNQNWLAEHASLEPTLLDHGRTPALALTVRF